MDGWRCYYRVADYTLSIEGGDSALVPWAESLYPCAQFGKGDPQRIFRVEGAKGRYHLLEGTNKLAEAESWPELFAVTEWRLTRALMEGVHALYQLHAGVVVLNGRALVLCGHSGAGKTSLTVGLGLRGGAVYGDEVAIFDADSLRVFSFPRDLIVRNGTRDLFPQIEQLELPAWKVFADYRHVPPQAWCPLAGSPVPCSGFVFPQLRHDGCEPSLRRLGPAEAAQRILEQSFNMDQWGKRGIDLVGQLAEQYPAWELVFADAERAADYVLASEIER